LIGCGASRTTGLRLSDTEFAPSIWNGWDFLVLEEPPASDVAESPVMSVNAILIAKPRVLKRLRPK
jgi:hypothetical protein